MEKKKDYSWLSPVAITATVIFVIQRILGVITWSWWLVLSPLLLWVGLVIFVVLILGFIVAVIGKYSE